MRDASPRTFALPVVRPATVRAARVAALTTITLGCFAANSLLCRAALGNHRIDAGSFTAIRIAAGALTLSAIVLARGERHRGSWPTSLALFVYAAAFSFAYLRIQAGTGALLLFGAVQTSMLGLGMLRGVWPTLRQCAGIAVATVGLAYLVAPGVARPDLVGAALMIAAGSAWGVYSVLGRGAARDAAAVNAGNFVRCVPLALALGFVTRPHVVTGAGVTLAVASGAVTSGVGYVLWYTVLPALGATRAAVVQLAVPVVAAAGAVLLLGEPVTSRLAISGVLVLTGIGLVAIAPVALRRS